MNAGLTPGCTDADVSVIGGGLVGLAVALGLQDHGRQVAVIDEGDIALRASRGNFGLVWVQGKGDSCPDYARLTRQSARQWRRFADGLTDATGIDIQLSQVGGLYICLTEEELQQRQQMLSSMRDALGGDYPFEVLDHSALKARVREIGPTVAGATWGPEDGHVNPLFLLRAMVERFLKRGGQLLTCGPVSRITPVNGGFEVLAGDHRIGCSKVVLAAGLGNKALAPQVGLFAPLEPNRGQVLIAERVRHFLDYPTGHVRQTAEGTIQCGDSKEDVGFDCGTTTDVLAAIAARAVRMFPLLAQVRLVRSWGALRVMTPDGYPIYQQSEQYPGAYLVTCHSGVTLAAAHAGPIATWIENGQQPDEFSLETFHGQRFSV
ncbi:NAD(P)/FAD-dependent oxidoreductase [Aestuariirhabdus litorea]|uniref:FAD-binding oxidoreductase n=1 Tax=Aestuariirhabdus litorea TaxID=2528527 RepID=A0A3P3VJI1_9GAMM|nr:FAD-dependent oxidoreductase [Aestuariirhabdus litorea]RRJ82870.1 FAD-binding oxidoreductase [Aestuariirhabdus litorea]RWW93029.1 FAD-dependent oxidoreductase [Endozoicomonadaceae bacterium GTF-13]